MYEKRGNFPKPIALPILPFSVPSETHMKLSGLNILLYLPLATSLALNPLTP